MWITTNPSHEVFRTSVADSELLIKGGGGGRGASHSYSEITGGAVSKDFFSLSTSIWSQDKGGGPRVPPLDPPLHI